MDFKSILIEKKDPVSSEVHSSSAILIEKKYIISTSHILSRFLNSNLKLIDDIKAGTLHWNSGRITFKVRALWQSNNVAHLVSKEANLFALFKCKNIEEFCRNKFKDWSMDFRENNNHLKLLAPLFCIFTIEKEIVNHEELKELLHTWLCNIYSIHLNKGDQIISRSAPFGTREFLNSLSEGVISSELYKSFLFLSDCSSSPGCEGGLIYYKQNVNWPVGIVISSLNWWRKEWSGFTLIGSIQTLLYQMVGNNLLVNVGSQVNILNNVLAVAEASVAQINCGAHWGSCVLLSKEKGIFITNSHVVEHELNIRVIWKSDVLPATLIYRNTADSTFDLAIVRCSKNLSGMSACNTTETSFNPGETVYCAGYPLLSTVSKPEGVTVTRGILSACNPYMLKTTCGVFPGFSGGAVLNSEGVLLGVVVCNTTLKDVNVTYPKFNMAVPYRAVADVISKYLMHEDSSILTGLRSSSTEAVRLWMRLEGSL